MEEGFGSYVPIREDSQRQQKSSSRKAVGFSFVLGLVLLIALCTPAILQRKRVRNEESAETFNVYLESRGPALGVSEKSVGVSAKPYSWSNSALQWQRTGYHFQPEKNWMNDPDGPLVYKGYYHLFYQYNPDSPVWGNITWGHAVSKDLINWEFLDLAMVPDQWYDVNGVWSGSATFVNNDTLVVLYTGSTMDAVQVQNLAVPEDPNDALLRKWMKSPANPVLTPPAGIGPKDFRDPTTGWLGPDGLWRIAIGSRNGTTGLVLIYKTQDFLQYELEGTMHSVAGTGMWECVDFFPVEASGSAVGLDTSVNGDDVKHVLKASLDDTKNDHYAIGTYFPLSNSFLADDPDIDVGIGLRYDYGKYYASKTFYDSVKKRRILWGWVTETDTTQADLLKGWASVQTVPRTVWLDGKTKTNLVQWPVEELDSLRADKVSLQDVVLSPGSVLQINTSDSDASQLDIQLTIDLTEETAQILQTVDVDETYNCSTSGGAAERSALGPFGLLVLADAELVERTALYFYISKTRDGRLRTFFCHDKTKSSLATDLTLGVQGGAVPVTEDESSLTLRTLVDHSIVESYVQGGRTCVTSRIYPTEVMNSAAKLFLFNNASNSVTVRSADVWQMQSALLRPYSESQSSS